MKNYEWMILEMVLSRKKQLSYALLARVRDYVIILLLKLHLFCSTREKICIIMTTCCLKFQISNQTSEKMQFEFELSEGFPVQTGLTRKSCWKFSVMLILNFLEKEILNFSDRWQLLSAARFESHMYFRTFYVFLTIDLQFSNFVEWNIFIIKLNSRPIIFIRMEIFCKISTWIEIL